MPKILVYSIYNLLLPIFLLLGFPSFIIKGIRRGGLARNFGQRFGFFDKVSRSALDQTGNFWIHAVSVGEVFSALKIIRSLHQIDSDRPIVLSTTTTTGFRVAEENADEKTTVIHNPIDLPLVIWSVVRIIRPAKLILVEAEVWPNLVASMKRRGTPICLVNARLSPRSETRYHQFLSWVEPIFSQIDCATVPFPPDRKRWAKLGVPEAAIHVVGSVKFDENEDQEPPVDQIRELQQWLGAQGVLDNAPVFLAGSTHDGEETLATRVWLELRKQFPDLALVIVPRHAERANEIARQLSRLHVNAVLRERPPNRVQSATQQGMVGSVCVANTTGELRAWYHLADVVMIGKSFTGKGGQNPVEPILAGKPVVVGPHMQNFVDVVLDLVSAGGIAQVPDENGLREMAAEFLAHPESGIRQSENGRRAMARHQGASERTAEILNRVTPLRLR